MKKALLHILLLLSASSFGQITLEGFVRAEDNGEPIPQVYVVNLTTEESATSNSNGFFSIEMSPTDTLLLSHISYDYLKFVIEEDKEEEDEQSDSAQEDDTDEGEKLITVIDLIPRSYLLEEIEVIEYAISSNKPRAMVLEEPNVPLEEDVVYPENDRKPSISAPVDLLYWYFGSRPRQLRELQRIKEEDEYRRKLELGNNRELLQQITGLSPDELEAFVWTCKYGSVEISTMSDYDLLVSLLQCYARYVQDRLDQDVLEDAENGW